MFGFEKTKPRSLIELNATRAEIDREIRTTKKRMQQIEGEIISLGNQIFLKKNVEANRARVAQLRAELKQLEGK